MKTADKLTALKLLERGRAPAFIATATGLPEALIVALADGLGAPALDRQALRSEIADLERMMRTAVPTREPAPHPVAPSPRPTPAPTPTRPFATAPTPGPALSGASPAPAIDELVRACRRSESKRTQSLGPKLTELAERITTALRAERESEEDKARRAAERTAAQAEVKRLEKALTEARARATAAGAPGGVRGGPCICSECGHELASPQALGAHKRHKHGIASTRAQETPA